jgi:hypothetical protein
MVAVLVAVAWVTSVETQTASARPNYKMEWDKKYMTEGSAIQKSFADGKSNCFICHQGKERKNRNAYGVAIQKALGEKMVKDATKIVEAFEKANKEKSGVEDTVFGDLIKSGKLPQTPEEK